MIFVSLLDGRGGHLWGEHVTPSLNHRLSPFSASLPSWITKAFLQGDQIFPSGLHSQTCSSFTGALAAPDAAPLAKWTLMDHSPKPYPDSRNHAFPPYRWPISTQFLRFHLFPSVCISGWWYGQVSVAFKNLCFHFSGLKIPREAVGPIRRLGFYYQEVWTKDV